MSNKSLYIREWGEIHKSEKNNQKSINKIEVNLNAFNELKFFAEADDKNNQFLKFKKSDVLKVKNFVGVITTKDGTQIEILPKIDEITDDKSTEQSRNTLTKMLKAIYNLPFIQTMEADLQLKNQPLPEVLMSWFLSCVDKIIKQGIRRDYLQIEGHEKFLKGQLQIHKQLNGPPHKQHLFHTKYNILSSNRLENRLIHSALLQVLKWSQENKNQKMAKYSLMFFDEVPVSKNIKDDFDKWSNERDMNYYQPVLPWLKLILNQQSPFTLEDKNAGISFLLPMEVLFEKYAAKILAKNLPKDYQLTEQSTGKYLSTEPKAFALKPDILIKNKTNKKTVCILDTKWKLINENQKYDSGNTDKKKGIKQSDVYQLFTYGKKYDVRKVMLIYPQWSGFTKEFNFKLDSNLKLGVMPFPFNEPHTDTHSIVEEILKIKENIT